MTVTIQEIKGRPNYHILIRYREDGKDRQKWIKTDIPIAGNNKRKIEKKRQKVEAEYSSDKVSFGKDILFTTFLCEWLETHKRSIQESTYDAYRLTVNSHLLPYFNSKKLMLKDIAPAHINQYINSKLKSNLSANTVNKHIANLSKCFKFAVKQEILKQNPIDLIEKPKKVKYNGAQHYDEHEIEKLLSISKGDPLELVILFGVFYGLRRSEVLGLKWSAINFTNKTISINHTIVRVDKKTHCKDSTKNEASNTLLPLPDIIISKLKKWRAKQSEFRLGDPDSYKNDYICTQLDGSLIKPRYVSDHFKLILKKHEMRIIRFHDLRHSSAGYLKHLGFDLKDIQMWLRHADIQTTMNLYLTLELKEKRNIADNLNDKFLAFAN